MTPVLSVVIPAFNEEARIGPYLAAIREYLDAEYPREYEVVVVDDGSRDGTAALVEQAAISWVPLRLIRPGKNQGKGAAVKIGGARFPFALGAEFGSKRFRQFEPWRGAGATAGYFMWPAIREEIPKLIAAYGDAIEKAFTDD